MKPSAVAVDIQSDPELAAEYNPISYPNTKLHWSDQHEQLPLHYMSEDTARRRVKVSAHEVYGVQVPNETYGEYNDGGKDVYNKVRRTTTIGSGRLPQPPLPPPTSVVSLLTHLHRDNV